MLKLDGLSVGYDGRVLLKEVSQIVGDGELILLAGSNGAGKSTLLKTLAGLLKPLEGTFESDRDCILVPTNIPKVKGFTVADFIRTSFCSVSGWTGRLDSGMRESAERSMSLLGVLHLKGRDVSSLSDGEFQKVCIAAAIARADGVILLDEPTAFLDVDSRADLLSMLRSLCHEHGLTVLFSSHDVLSSIPYADRVFSILADGTLSASDGSEESKMRTVSAAFRSL